MATSRRTATIVAASNGAADSNHIFTAVKEAWDLSRAATDAAKTANAAIASTRTDIMVNIANAAHAANWSAEIVIAATKQLEKAINDVRLKKTVTNFTGEVKRFCNPNVREHVANAFQLAADAWDADKSVMTKAFARQYMYVTGTLLPMLEAGKKLPADGTVCVELAKAGLTDDRAAKEVEKILKDTAARLEKLNKPYGHSSIKNAVAALKNLTAQSLLLSAETEKNGNAHREQMATIAANGGATAPMPAPAKPSEAAPIAGAVDIESLLAGMATMQNQIAALVLKQK